MLFNQEKIWDQIADLWEKYKIQPTHFTIEFLEKQKGRILDLGCGSGRNFTKTKAKLYAVDFSQEMIDLAKENAKKQELSIEITKANATRLPFKSNFFNAAIAIDVFHCIRPSFRRKKAVKELHRVLKPKGTAMISIWHKEARRFRNKPKNIKVPWTVKGKKFFRYYYLYDKEEFELLLKKIGFKIAKRIETRSKFILIVQKV